MAARNSVSQSVFAAAQNDKVLTMFAMLCNRSAAEVKTILMSPVEQDGQITTPLSIAARNGHLRVVRLLLEHFNVDIEQEGTVKFDGYPIEGATALWCASGAGHFEIVKTLVSSSADVNHATKSNSTPLRAACFDGRLDIVKHLVENNADINIPNKYNNTCLMIASYKGRTTVVHYLLECGADPNVRAHCGATALHFATEQKNLDIVKLLSEHGAEMLKNDQQLTPLHVAAENSHAEIFEFFISHVQCTKHDRIEALELLGASYANSKDNYDIEKCYQYLWLSLQERSSDPDGVLKKELQPPVEEYFNQIECTTVAELEAIRDNTDALHIEALLVRERILGVDNADIPHPIIFRGAVCADNANFEQCTALWMRALKLRHWNKHSINKDLLRFAQVFSQMIHVDENVKFALAKQVFHYMLEELQRNQSQRVEDADECIHEIYEDNVHTALYLLDITIKIRWAKDDDIQFCRLVYRFNALKLRLRDGRTPLHLACDETAVVDDFHVNDVVSFPNDVLVRYLIQCGADVDAADANGNTPLHTIMKYNRPITDFLTLHNVIAYLNEAEVHVDQVNKNGETAMDVTTTGVAEIILRTKQKMTLKCLAARSVRRNGVAYQGHIPVTLEQFVQLH